MRRLAVLLVACAAVTAGCGRTISTQIHGGTVTVYSSSPLNGERAALGNDLIVGEKLAIKQFKGIAGKLLVKFVAYDSAQFRNSGYDRDKVLTNAQNALDDSSIAAYIGEATPGATRISLPVLSSAGIAVISPTDPDPQLQAPPGAATGPDQIQQGGATRYGFSLARLSDAQAMALAGPGFTAAYAHAYGGRPNATVARGFDAMHLVFEAIAEGRRPRADRITVNTALGRLVARAGATIAR